MYLAFVDDLREDRMQLRHWAEGWAAVHRLSIQTDSYDSAAALLTALPARKYDIIFSDIYMPDMDGLKLAERLFTLRCSSLLVLCTVSMDHQQDALSRHVFDYLQKPVTEPEMFRVLDDAAKLLFAPEPALRYSLGGTEVSLPYSALLYLYSDGHYTKVAHTDGRTDMPYVNFRDLAAQLSDDPRFLQLTRGVLCNMDYILSLTKTGCVLNNRLVLPVTLRRARQLERQWRSYQFARLHAELKER